MLTRLDLEYFKCFERLNLPLAPLTLLSGSNASGKSSVLQALVLLHQTMCDNEWSVRLMLNGATLCLGTVSDIIDKINGRTTLQIGISDDDNTIKWEFSGERSDMSMAVQWVLAKKDVSTIAPDQLRYMIPMDAPESAMNTVKRIRGLSYITAERLGPREVYILEDKYSASVVGPLGEHSVSLLHWGRDEHVIEDLVLPNVPPTRLRQVEARMQTLFPGCTLSVQQVPQANAVSLGIRTSDDTDFHRPIHVGFGLTQILPIVVAALSASKDDILLIENPEVHLHPAGQAQMGKFLAEAARAGIQVIVETHSDHVLNGIRRSVKEQVLQAQQIAIHFFKPRSLESTQVLSPTLDNSGNIDVWPDGFFDQFDKDMNYFAGWEI